MMTTACSPRLRCRTSGRPFRRGWETRAERANQDSRLIDVLAAWHCPRCLHRFKMRKRGRVAA